MGHTVLIVEDDRDLNETVAKFLSLKGYRADSCYDGQEALDRLYEHRYDLVLLDVKLPSLNGFEVAKEIRAYSNVPIIFLTSLDTQKDIEAGFLCGGDDYLTKPFVLSELLLRIEAVCRRVYKNRTVIPLGEDLHFDTHDLILKKGDEEIKLKHKERKLLMLLLQHEGEILGKEEIMNALYDYEEMPNEASLRTFIYNLRKVLPKGKIETIKEQGYRYVG